MLNTSAESAGAGRSGDSSERCWVPGHSRGMRHCTELGLAAHRLRLNRRPVEGHRGSVARHQFEFAEVPGGASSPGRTLSPRSPPENPVPSPSARLLGGPQAEEGLDSRHRIQPGLLFAGEEPGGDVAPRGVRRDPLQVDSDFRGLGKPPRLRISRSATDERNGARAGQVRLPSASAANTRLSGGTPRYPPASGAIRRGSPSRGCDPAGIGARRSSPLGGGQHLRRECLYVRAPKPDVDRAGSRSISRRALAIGSAPVLPSRHGFYHLPNPGPGRRHLIRA